MADEWVQWTYCEIIDYGSCSLVDPAGYRTSDPITVLGAAGGSNDAYVVMEGADPRIRVQFKPWVDGIPAGVNDIRVGFRYVAGAPNPLPASALTFTGYNAGAYWGAFTHPHPALPGGEMIAHDDVTYTSSAAVATWDYVQAGTWQMEVRNTSGATAWLSLLQYGGKASTALPVTGLAPLRALQRGDGRNGSSAPRAVQNRTRQATNRAVSFY